jgi:hypothetical protein
MGVIQKTFAATALLAATTGAWAVTATASVSNIQFQVFDLTPLDGIAPSFSILSTWGNAFAYTENGLSNQQSILPASALINAPGLALAGSSTGLALDPSSFSVTSSLSDTALSTYGSAGAYGTANFKVSVGAGTLLLVTADSSVAADNAGSVSGTWMVASSSLQFNEYMDGSSFYSYNSRNAYTGFSGYSNATPSSSGLISLSFTNATGESVDVTLYAHAQSSLETPLATPVPEPTTAAMLLSGLGVAFGVAFRRRERRA